MANIFHGVRGAESRVVGRGISSPLTPVSPMSAAINHHSPRVSESGYKACLSLPYTPKKLFPGIPYALPDIDSTSEEPDISIRLINVRTDPFSWIPVLP